MNYKSLFLFLLIFSEHSYGTDYATSSGNAGQFASQLTAYSLVLGYAWTHGKTPFFQKEVLISQEGGELNYNRVFYRLPQGIPADLNYDELYHVNHYSSLVPLPFIPGNVCLCGVQHEFWYFKEHIEKIRELFLPSEDMIQELRSQYASILDHPKTVAIHIRTYRPDLYFHRLLEPEYFQNAMNYFSNDHLFVVFSDRIDWCKKHFKTKQRNVIFVQNTDYILDFYLMSLCKNIITSNSTFSWWAALLKNDPNGLVIAPSRWFRDPYNENPDLNIITRKFYPPEWIVIPTKSPDPDWTVVEFETTSVHEK